MKLSTIVSIVTNITIAKLILWSSLVSAHPIQKSTRQNEISNHWVTLNENNSIVISWQSYTNKPAVVKYGQSSKMLLLDTKASSKPYLSKDNQPSFLNEIELRDLMPSTIYYYELGDASEQVHSFLTPPEYGNDSPFSFAMVNSRECVKRNNDNADELIKEHSGTFVVPSVKVASSLHLDKYDYEFIWQIGKDQDLCLSTHADMSSLSDEKSRTQLFISSHHKKHSWYSFNYGLAHFIQLDTDADNEETNMQIQWLQSDLKNVQRKITPWVIVSFQAKQKQFEKILSEFQVDVAFITQVNDESHAHKITIGHKTNRNSNYMEYPQYHYDNVGTIFINNGLIGPKTETTHKNTSPQGWGKVTVLNNTHLLYEYISYSEDNIISSIPILRQHEEPTSVNTFSRDTVEPTSVKDFNLEGSLTSISTPLTTLELLKYTLGEEYSFNIIKE